MTSLLTARPGMLANRYCRAKKKGRRQRRASIQARGQAGALARCIHSPAGMHAGKQASVDACMQSGWRAFKPVCMHTCGICMRGPERFP
eukprot:37504-Chlamydomonas_euryale.AAC.3